MTISARTQICMIIGDPVSSSLSPAMHNAGYAAAGIADRFVYVACRVTSADLGKAVDGIRTLGIRGVSVTMPHKRALLPLLDRLDPSAEQTGAANTIVNDDGTLTGYNTDVNGVVEPLKALRSLQGTKVALLGAGGAASAAAFGLAQAGADVTIFNRSADRGLELARKFKCAHAQFEGANFAQYDVILNATPVGMTSEHLLSLVPAEQISAGQIIFEMIYAPAETPLVLAAKSRGARIIFGKEMLAAQGARQFELFTETAAPIDAMRGALK